MLREKREVSRHYGLLNYRPHPKQDRFHRANFLYRLAMCGNRFGKSEMGCAEDLAWIRGERIWYPKDDPARTIGIPQRPVKGLVITVDWDKVKEIWTNEHGDDKARGKIWQMVPHEMVQSKSRNHSGAIDFFAIRNGKWTSTLRFDTVQSWKGNPQSGESSDFDFIHVDEPCPEKMFNSHSRGMVDRGGSAWFTLTPLQEMWIIDRFFPAESNARNLPDAFTAGEYWAIRGSMHDNPYLSAKGKEEYLKTLSEDERQCREFGIPLELSGLVYKQFDYDKHVLSQIPFGWKDFSTPPSDWPVYVYIDIHPREPHAVLFLTVSPWKQIYVFYEIFAKVDLAQLCDMIHQVVDKYNVIHVKCDPLAWVENPADGSVAADVFYKKGIMVEKAMKALTLGIVATQNALSHPGLIFVSPLCKRFIYEVNRYCWDSDKEKPVDKDDHMMENLYRAILDELKWVPRSDFSKGPVGDIEINRSETELEDLDIKDW